MLPFLDGPRSSVFLTSWCQPATQREHSASLASSDFLGKAKCRPTRNTGFPTCCLGSMWCQGAKFCDLITFFRSSNALLLNLTFALFLLHLIKGSSYIWGHICLLELLCHWKFPGLMNWDTETITHLNSQIEIWQNEIY